MPSLRNTAAWGGPVPDRQILVECYSGFKGDERPVRIQLQDGPHEVTEVEDKWYSPGGTFFRVRLANGDRYVLRHSAGQDVWTIEAFRSERPERVR